jgi:taurine dioxygenase
MDFTPPEDWGLPTHMNIDGRSPFGKGVWQGGGIGFRWDKDIKM